MKLSSIFQCPPLTPPHGGAGRWCACLLVVALAACGTAPSQPTIDRLDPDTATTVTVIRKPVELVVETPRVTVGDPFAFLAPFETNRMGSYGPVPLGGRSPRQRARNLEPQLLCDGNPVTLRPVEGGVKQLGLAHPPYATPAPWSQQWYFQLAPEALSCFAGAQRLTLETRASSGDLSRYSVEGKDLDAFKAFSNGR